MCMKQEPLKEQPREQMVASRHSGSHTLVVPKTSR